MGLFDRALNAAADAARTSAANHERTERRRAVDAQILAHQQTIQWSTGRIGQLALQSGATLPPAAAAAADAARRWQAELTQLTQQLHQLSPTG